MGVSIVLSSTAVCLAMVSLIPVLPAIQNHFRATPNVAFLTGILISMMGPTLIVGSPLGAIIAERIGQRRFVVAAMTVFGVSGLAGYFLDNLHLILLNRLVTGLSMAGFNTILPAMLVTYFDEDARSRWLGYFTAVGSLAALPLLPLCGWLGTFGWKTIFLAYVIAFPLAALLAFTLPKEAATAQAGEGPAAGPAAPEKPGFTLPWGVLAMGLTCGIALGATSIYVPFHAANAGVRGSAQISMVMLGLLISGPTSSFMFGFLAKRLSAAAIFALAFAIMGPAYIVMSYADSFSRLAVSITVLGLGSGLLSPNIFSLAAAKSAPAHRSRVIGLAAATLFAGPLAAQVALAPVSAKAGPSGALLAVGIMGCAVSLLCLLHLLQSRFSRRRREIASIM